jgi:hypothetical protein
VFSAVADPICDICLIKKAISLYSALHNYEVYSKCDDKYAIYANELFRPYYSSVFTDRMT